VLTGEESLPADWPVAGTTGYDFLNEVNGLFVEAENDETFDALYREFTGSKIDFIKIVYASKKRILLSSFFSELDALTRRLQCVAAASRMGQDFALGQLRAALAEVLAAFPVYRTYIDEQTRNVHAAERDYILKATHAATRRASEAEPDILSFLERVLLLEPIPDLGAAEVKGVL